MKQTVTVSIPVYNGEKFVLQALKSVIDQTIKVDELIICDNCSSDKTIQLIKDFQSAHKDHKIKLILNEVNIGFQNNFIKCYYSAKTDFLVILHVDDILKQNDFVEQFNFF